MQIGALVARASGEVCLEEARKSDGRSSALRPAPSSPEESGPVRVRSSQADDRSDEVPIDYVSFGGGGESGERMALVQTRPVRVLGRYLLGDQIAAGGMASVHLGRLLGAAGFSRTVAVKKLHAHLARNPQFVQRFIDEARIASRIRHANVVQTLDIVSDEGELLLVLDYVHGESFAKLRRLSLEKGISVPPNVAAAIIVGVLRGLHAAHEAKSANGAPLGCVHRDVSPQNILVGADGVSRVLDFGIAKAAGRLAESLTRNVKGKLAYMSPQQVAGDDLDRRADIFATGVVLWEALAGERLFRGDDAASTIDAVYHREAPALSERGLGIPPAVDAVLAQSLSKSLEHRFESADAMARALEIAIPPAHEREVAEWVERIGRDAVAERASKVSIFERADLQIEARPPSAKPIDEHPLPLRTVRPAVAPRVDLDRTFQPPAKARRRDALVPPPMPESGAATVTEGHDASNDTDREAAPPVALQEMTPRHQTEPVRRSSSLVRMRTEPVPRPNPTPMVMMLAPNSSSALPASPISHVDDLTRAAPITPGHPLAPEAIARMNMRTPVSMPMPSSRLRPSPMRLALLVVIPPIAVAAALFGLRLKSADRDPGAAAAGSPPAAMFLAAEPPPGATETALVPPPAAPPMAPPPVAAPPEPPAPSASSTSAAATGAAPQLKRTPAKPPPIKRPTRPAGRPPGIPRDRN